MNLARSNGLGADRHAADEAVGRTIAPDIVTLADMQRCDDTAWRIAAEVRVQAAGRLRSALAHVETDVHPRLPYVHPDIHACVEDGAAEAIDPDSDLTRTPLLVVHDPAAVLARVSAGAAVLPRIAAAQAVLVAGPGNWPIAPDVVTGLARGLLSPNIRWSATDAATRAQLGSHGIAVEGPLWQASLAAERAVRIHAFREVPVVGCAGLAALRWAEAALDEMILAMPAPDQGRVRILVPSRELRTVAWPESWEVIGSEDMSLERFVRTLDRFVYCPAEPAGPVPEIAIAAALCNGVPVFLHPSQRKRFGDIAVYVEPGGAREAAGRPVGDRSAQRQAAEQLARTGRERWGAHLHRDRVEAILGSRPRISGTPSPASASVLFVTPNGVGLGHLTRSLAIARRMPAEIEPVFATMSQAVAIVEQAGFPVEYIPSMTYTGADPGSWNAWLREELCQLCQYYRPGALVFDGPAPFPGLLGAMAAQRSSAAVWVRRGMWRDGTDPLLRSQALFDLVIEPGDVAEEADFGATVRHRQAVLRVPPISLLEPEELLSREEARARLDLDPSQLAVLIQLGAGGNRDVAVLTDRILSEFASRPDIQVVLAEWLISPLPLDLWSSTRRVRGFPLQKYYRAFDFTISAAGYNSFNEIVMLGLPAIFIANDRMLVDKQEARAAYAHEQGAAIVVSEKELHGLGLAIKLMTEERVRWLLQSNCRRLAKPNGATDAARAIAELLLA